MMYALSPELVAALTALIAAPLASIVTWRLSRQHQAAQTDSALAQAASVSVDTMLAVMEQLKQDIADLTEENQKLREQTQALHKEVQRLARLVRELGGRP
jgi:cell division protein FtsB